MVSSVQFALAQMIFHIATNISLLSGAQQSIDSAVYLHLDTTVELDKLRTAEGCITNARSPEVVAALEELVTQWCQQIEQVCVCVLYGMRRVIL